MRKRRKRRRKKRRKTRRRRIEYRQREIIQSVLFRSQNILSISLPQTNHHCFKISAPICSKTEMFSKDIVIEEIRKMSDMY
jgi:hypothetical protein